MTDAKEKSSLDGASPSGDATKPAVACDLLEYVPEWAREAMDFWKKCEPGEGGVFKNREWLPVDAGWLNDAAAAGLRLIRELAEARRENERLKKLTAEDAESAEDEDYPELRAAMASGKPWGHVIGIITPGPNVHTDCPDCQTEDGDD